MYTENESVGCTACPRSTQAKYIPSVGIREYDPWGQTFMKASVIPAKSAPTNRENKRYRLILVPAGKQHTLTCLLDLFDSLELALFEVQSELYCLLVLSDGQCLESDRQGSTPRAVLYASRIDKKIQTTSVFCVSAILTITSRFLSSMAAYFKRNSW